MQEPLALGSAVGRDGFYASQQMDDPPLNVVETPTSPSSAFALSRFEFETGRGNEGTKVLMVEWDSTAVGRDNDRNKDNGHSRVEQSAGSTDDDSQDSWDITWDGKTPTNALPAQAVAATVDESGLAKRMYYLLPPGVNIPALVSIRRGATAAITSASTSTTTSPDTHKSTDTDKTTTGTGDATFVLRTKPMPAIFPAASAGGPDAGRLGVLHSLWAQLRLADLTAEITAEMQSNSESIGLQIALQEYAWICDHFGVWAQDVGALGASGTVGTGAAGATGAAGGTGPAARTAAMAAASFLFPAGAGNTSRIRGINLEIPGSQGLLHNRRDPLTPTASPRSPTSGSKLGEKLKGLRLATSPAELEAAVKASSLASRSIAKQPPVQAVPRAPAVLGTTSLDAVVQGGIATQTTGELTADGEDELFALPLSPRSPDMAKSPFSVLRDDMGRK